MMRCAVLATMKNEGPFLLEWVAHHKALGFDDIVICTNDCADGTDAMVRRLAEMGLARHHETVKRGSSRSSGRPIGRRGRCRSGRGRAGSGSAMRTSFWW